MKISAKKRVYGIMKPELDGISKACLKFLIDIRKVEFAIELEEKINKHPCYLFEDIKLIYDFINYNRHIIDTHMQGTTLYEISEKHFRTLERLKKLCEE